MSDKKHKLSKRARIIDSLNFPNTPVSLREGIKALKVYHDSCGKFDESVDIVIALSINPKQSDQNVRGFALMPHGLGREIKVAAFVNQSRVQEAKEAGADIVGSEELIEEFKKMEKFKKAKKQGLDFDICIASPDMMSKVGALGRILGPKGLMPHPKVGTVTTDFVHTIKQIKSGQVAFKSEKGGLIHCSIGKCSFLEDSLYDNAVAIYNAVVTAKPQTVKGASFVLKIFINTTHGPSIPIDISSVLN